MVAPVIIGAIISAVASKYAADQAAKSAAAQSAAEAAKRPPPEAVQMQPVTLEGLTGESTTDAPASTPAELPTGADMAGPQPLSDAGSAHARTLQGLNSPLVESPEGVPPALDPNYTGPPPQQPQVPQTQVGDTSGKMTGLEMAQLGLTLGSMLGKRNPGPGIPSLPGGSAPAMKPVFRG